MKKEYIDWGWFGQELSILKKQIIKDKFSPTVVVGIMRGGIIPAVMLSHQFDVPCKSVEWSLRDFGGKDYDKISSLICSSVSDNILFVEDIIDSGKTMLEVQTHVNDCLTNKYPNKDKYRPTVKYASMWFNTNQPTTVDYYATAFDREVNKNWFVFPFEKQ